MPVIQAVVTDAARAKWPKMFGGLVPFKQITNFKVGLGGWIDPGTGKQPRAPDPTLPDLDALVDLLYLGGRPGNGFGVKRYVGYGVVPNPVKVWFPGGPAIASPGRLIPGANMFFEPPSTIRIQCVLDTTDFNDDGSGLGPPLNEPIIWEIGLFDDDNTMLAYGTFPFETKHGQIIENDVRIIF